MAKFALECPHCGSVNQASTFFLAKKVITCGNCKSSIDVKTSRMTIGNCKKCGSVSFDRKKGTCPLCKGPIEGLETKNINSIAELKERSKNGTPLFLCPQCSCEVQVVDHPNGLLCPICDYSFKGYEEIYNIIQKSRIVNDVGISVIKYEGDNDTFVWKHPIEDFNTGSQLLVHESQEAIFIVNGKAMDLFGPGRHTLETENLPVLSKMYDLPTGKQNPFHAEVYFINQTTQMNIKWGTDTRINFIEPTTGLPLDIGAFGELNLQVCDSRKLLVKLVGARSGIAWGEGGKNFTQSLANSFRPHIVTTVKSYLATAIKENNINILDIDSKLAQLSEYVGAKVSEGFEEYGLTVPQFYIRNVDVPQDGNAAQIRRLLSKSYLGVREAEIDADIQRAKLESDRVAAEKLRIEAQAQADKAKMEAEAKAFETSAVGLAEADVMRAKGYSQRDVLQADVQKAYAEGIGNIGSGGGEGGNGGGGGGMMSDILGLSVGMAAMGAVGEKVGGVMRGFNSNMNEADRSFAEHSEKPQGWKCSCGCEGNLGKFCSECGSAKPELWDCPHCGAKDNKDKFCSECGSAKPELWDCPHCGAKGNKGKFCSECGKTKDAPAADTWDCECGAKGIKGKFCSECGRTRPEAQSTWDCECGNKGITGKFCSECGKQKEDN